MEWVDPLLASGVRFMTLILLAALGGVVTSWTRDLNVGLEGGMLFGAFLSVVIAYRTGSVAIALGVTMLLGIVSGLVFGLLITALRVNVFVAGFVLNIFAAGGTVYLLRTLFGVKGTFSDPSIPSMPRVTLPVIDQLPVLGPLLSGHTVLTYVGWALVAFMLVVARSSVVARHLRVAGENPMALATAGVSVARMRVLAQVWCFALCALGGAQLSLGQLTLFTEGMTSGLGFVALAVVIFSQGRVLLLAVMSFVFGLSTAVSVQIDTTLLPPQFSQMLPYVVALVGLIVLSRSRTESPLRIARPVLDE